MGAREQRRSQQRKRDCDEWVDQNIGSILGADLRRHIRESRAAFERKLERASLKSQCHTTASKTSTAR